MVIWCFQSGNWLITRHIKLYCSIKWRVQWVFVRGVILSETCQGLMATLRGNREEEVPFFHGETRTISTASKNSNFPCNKPLRYRDSDLISIDYWRLHALIDEHEQDTSRPHPDDLYANSTFNACTLFQLPFKIWRFVPIKSCLMRSLAISMARTRSGKLASFVGGLFRIL